ncbi:hypothetical protein IFR05_013135 [Cadophora sp. M221]|nr:hypothetical protein IFR05_013135 [Cadophora sp. M221]
MYKDRAAKEAVAKLELQSKVNSLTEELAINVKTERDTAKEALTVSEARDTDHKLEAADLRKYDGKMSRKRFGQPKTVTNKTTTSTRYCAATEMSLHMEQISWLMWLWPKVKLSLHKILMLRL